MLAEFYRMIPTVSMALATLLGFWFLAWVLVFSLKQVTARMSPAKQPVIHLLQKMVYVFVWLIGIISALGTLGINVSAMVTSLGLTGFAIGFALKDALSNMLAGVMVLLYQPFRVGDSIQMGEQEGEVIAIDLRYTTLRANHKKILIPNAILLTKSITLKVAS